MASEPIPLTHAGYRPPPQGEPILRVRGVNFAFGTGEVCGRTMMRHGFAADLFGIVVISAVCWVLLR